MGDVSPIERTQELLDDDSCLRDEATKRSPGGSGMIPGIAHPVNAVNWKVSDF